MSNFSSEYDHVRGGGNAYRAMDRGLIEVWGGEAVQFLNGMITNDIEALADGEMMRAALPNSKGRLLAVVRVKRRGDKYLFETEEVTHDAVYSNLARFTMAGDFNVEDVSGKYRFVSLLNFEYEAGAFERFGSDLFIDEADFDAFTANAGALELSEATYETIRIEEGIPLYGVDMDESTVVPETGIEGLIHYQKGCYIGQEVIARIHFLGKPAKLLKGLVFDKEIEPGSMDLVSEEDKNAGRITSQTFSPKMGGIIALGYVRSAFATGGTRLFAGAAKCEVSDLPFFD